MLEIRKGTAAKNYENTFFREFAENLKNLFDKYTLDGLLIANSECEVEKRLQIDALLITEKAVCIIDFKNFGGKISLPNNAKSEFDIGKWTNEKGEIVKGGSSINPFIQLKIQKHRFIKVVESQILDRLPTSDCFNPSHTVRTVCFQKPIELIGSIPPKEELNFFIIDKANYLEKIKDIIDVSDKEVSLTKESYEVFKDVFRADLFDLSENYGETFDFTTYETELDFENLYPDQKSALQEIESFIKSKDDRFFVLQGTSLSGKTHLIPFIQDVAYNNQIPEAKLFASSGRVANNLLKNTNLKFNSIYSYIYGGNITNSETEEKEEAQNQDKDKIDLEVVPLKKSDDTEEAIFIVDESHLISDNYHQSIDLRFGSGKLLKDFIEFADLKNTKRKIIFIGDSFQLSIGKKEESALNPEYLSDEYNFKAKAFQLVDKEMKSPIVAEGLKAVNCIRNQLFNNLKFEISDSLEILSKNKLKEKIQNSLNSNSHILCYSNFDAQKVNFWIKSSILENGHDLTKGDLVIFGNTIRVEDENDPFAEPKKIFNGQFGKVVSVSKPITKTKKLITPLTFREVTINLQESNHTLSFLSLENFRLSDKGELSKEEIISYKILLYQLAEKEVENFRIGKYHVDEDLKDLLQEFAKGKRVKQKVITKIQRSLSDMPATDYYKFKNVAQLRFGWALTVHKSMSYKWDEIFFNVETGGGKTNETYFKWIYTGLIRSTSKVNLINYTPISTFYKVDLKPTIPQESNVKDLFYIADTSIDLSNLNKEVADKYKFKDNDFKSYLLQLHQFIEGKITNQKISINSINHPNYQELYELKGNSGETATISIYYNKKGQFKMPLLMKAQPKEFGEDLLNILKADNFVDDFSFIKDKWRATAYIQLNEMLKEKDLAISYIIQAPYKDTVQLICCSGDKITIDLYYDGDGFFSTISALSLTEPSLWTDFQSIINKLKDGQMTTLFDFSRHIAGLKKAERYSEALSYFKKNKKNFSKEQLSNNEYIVSDMISCLRYTNQFDAGFQFLKIYEIKIDENQKERILTAYGWLLWSKYKAENENDHIIDDETQFFDDDEDDFQQQNYHYIKTELIERIETLIPILMELNSDFSKMLVSKLFSIVLKYERNKPAPNWKLVNDFCNQIDPTLLSTDCSTIQVERKGRTQDMELASDFENWYAYKTKALMKLGKWQECFEISKEALEKIDSFHYSNDVWFSRRVALSKKNLGNTEDTIEELKNILKKKREWFIQKELAELYFEKDDLEAAFKMAIDAINNFGPLEFKVDLLYLIGKILNKQGETDLAFKHFNLSKLVRQDKGWKVPQKVFDELNKFEQRKISVRELKNLQSELEKYWNGFNQNKSRKHNSKDRSNSEHLKGEIIRILHDNERGKDGFIKSDGNEFYFLASNNWYLTSEITIGTKVIFTIIPAKDGKKELTRILKLVDE